MSIEIKRAVRQRIWLKIAITGTSGSGKTWGGIDLAKGLVSDPTKILVLDTENESACSYAGSTDTEANWVFDHLPMHPPFTTAKYVAAIKEAVALGYEALIIDSVSHEWDAQGGILDQKSDLDARNGEKWGNWKAPKAAHADFKESLLQSPIHIIATMRSKQEYVLEKDERGKQVPKKLGLAPIQEKDSDYDFFLVFDIDRDSHLAIASKDRTNLFNNRSFKVSREIGKEIRAWRDSGAELAPTTTTAPATATNVTASPVATVDTRATNPEAQSAVQPVAQGSQPEPTPSPEWVELIAQLAAVTLASEMPEKSRQKLLDLWMAEDQSKPDELRKEIATIRSTIKVETMHESFTEQQQEALARKSPVSQAASDFVDSIDPDPCISPEQYEALNALLGAYEVNRDCFRSYCAAAGKLLPGKNGPTLARLKAEEFTKFRDKLQNKTKAGKTPNGKEETWSARTIRIINATPKTTFQPIAAAS